MASVRQFLGAVDALLQPEGVEPPDPAVWDRLPQPKLVSSLRGVVCRFEFEEEGLWIVLQVRPAAHLLLRREGRMSRFLDSLGIGGEVKVGVPDFDARYRVLHITRGDARAIFGSGPARQLVGEMEPFQVLEMAERELKLLKSSEQGYTPQKAVEDLERLFAFHMVTMRIDLPDAGV